MEIERALFGFRVQPTRTRWTMCLATGGSEFVRRRSVVSRQGAFLCGVGLRCLPPYSFPLTPSPSPSPSPGPWCDDGCLISYVKKWMWTPRQCPLISDSPVSRFVQTVWISRAEPGSKEQTDPDVPIPPGILTGFPL